MVYYSLSTWLHAGIKDSMLITTLTDFLSAGIDEAVTAVIESDAFPKAVKNIADVAVTGVTASMVSGVLGTLAQRVHGVYLGYKESRFERHVLKALEEI